MTAQADCAGAGLLAAALLAAALPSHAQDLHRAERDTAPRLSVQTPYGFNSGGSQGSYYFQTTPGTAFSAYNATRGFTDLSIAQPLGFVRELGIGNVSATLGARVAEPLIANGFTPAIDDRRYLGVGPRVGLQGNAPVNSSWNVEWQVGASMLFGNGSLAGGAADQSGHAIFRLAVRLRRQCRRPARPDPLVRCGVQADARLSRRRAFQEYAEAQFRRARAAAERGPHRPRTDGPLHDPEVICSAVIPGRVTSVRAPE